MYFVNRSEIEQLLDNFDEILQEVTDASQFNQTKLQQLALERVVQILIESILDVGNKMIDGFIMRDPGSYHDIIDILVDERVLPENESKAYKSFIDARQMIVRQYHETDLSYLIDTLFSHKNVLTHFSTHI